MVTFNNKERLKMKVQKETAEKVRNELRSYMVKKGLSIQEVADRLTEKYGRPESAQNLSNKLNRGAIKYAEVLEIAEVLDYKIEWVEK